MGPGRGVPGPTGRLHRSCTRSGCARPVAGDEPAGDACDGAWELAVLMAETGVACTRPPSARIAAVPETRGWASAMTLDPVLTPLVGGLCS
jgi:hypothetical protein